MLHTLIVSASCVSYSQLNLGENRIDPEGARSLADALKVNASLTTLDISNNKIADEGVKPICEALKENKTLTSLDLNARTVSGGEIGPQGAKYIAEMLSVNASLTQVLAFCQHPLTHLPEPSLLCTVR